MPPGLECARQFSHPRTGIGKQSIDERRFSHARLPDQNAALAFQERHNRADIAMGAHRDDRIAQRGKLGEPVRDQRECGKVLLVGDKHEAATVTLGGDDPAMHELVVVRRIGRHETQHLRYVGGEKLVALYVGAEEKRRSRRHRNDGALVRGRPFDLPPVSARDRKAAPAQYAGYGFAIVEPNRIVTAMSSRHQARGVARHVALILLSVASQLPLSCPSVAN